MSCVCCCSLFVSWTMCCLTQLKVHVAMQCQLSLTPYSDFCSTNFQISQWSPPSNNFGRTPNSSDPHLLQSKAKYDARACFVLWFYPTVSLHVNQLSFLFFVHVVRSFHIKITSQSKRKRENRFNFTVCAAVSTDNLVNRCHRSLCQCIPLLLTHRRHCRCRRLFVCFFILITIQKLHLILA